MPPALAERYAKKLEAVKALSIEQGATAVMIIKDGVVLAEWGDTTTPTNLHSIRKSIISGLIGIAVERGQINLDSTLEQLGIDDCEPRLTAEEKKATVHDLLKARSGVFHNALYETEGMRKMRPPRGSHPRGTHWYYNNWDFNALGTIYEMAVGCSIYEALDREIAKPLGMQDYSPANCKYVRGADSNHAAYPINMSARDLARFALLYLNHGRWNDKQIISEAWVKASAKPYSETGTGGYGYLWWTADHPDRSGGKLAGSYHAAGSGGQSAYVIPSHNMVIVHRVDTRGKGFKKVKGPQIEKLVEMIIEALDK